MYCKKILELGLMRDIPRISKDFVFQQDSAPVHRSHHTINWATDQLLNPLIATLKPQSNGPSNSNTVIGTLAVDGWSVTFATARRGLGGTAAWAPPRCTRYNSPPINGQCTNVVLFDIGL